MSGTTRATRETRPKFRAGEVVPDVDHQHLFIIVGAARGKKNILWMLSCRSGGNGLPPELPLTFRYVTEAALKPFLRTPSSFCRMFNLPVECLTMRLSFLCHTDEQGAAQVIERVPNRYWRMERSGMSGATVPPPVSAEGARMTLQPPVTQLIHEGARDSTNATSWEAKLAKNQTFHGFIALAVAAHGLGTCAVQNGEIICTGHPVPHGLTLQWKKKKKKTTKNQV
ncbi:uncharacterized protein LOC128822426 [Vidua macroura]|uniref:uncharacterized protein LOC128822426 n=1 Tax=Vidua macroura TaxID=187451 RepID=UPI0023A89CF1|nr:uncharacterized protein LOC128822426 [Vidua macroura]